MRLEREIYIFKSGWESKRRNVYASGVRAELTKCQWWVEQKKEEALRSRGSGGWRRWNRRGGGVIGNHLGKQRPRGLKGRFSRL